ncbi:TPA: hypothetical protein ACH3X1_007825 [Trebouxia sp. C0004]
MKGMQGGDGDKPKQTSASASNKEGDVQQVTKKRGRPSTQDVFVDSTNKGADPSASLTSDMACPQQQCRTDLVALLFAHISSAAQQLLQARFEGGQELLLGMLNKAQHPAFCDL